MTEQDRIEKMKRESTKSHFEDARKETLQAGKENHCLAIMFEFGNNNQLDVVFPIDIVQAKRHYLKAAILGIKNSNTDITPQVRFKYLDENIPVFDSQKLIQERPYTENELRQKLIEIESKYGKQSELEKEVCAQQIDPLMMIAQNTIRQAYFDSDEKGKKFLEKFCKKILPEEINPLPLPFSFFYKASISLKKQTEAISQSPLEENHL